MRRQGALPPQSGARPRSPAPQSKKSRAASRRRPCTPRAMHRRGESWWQRSNSSGGRQRRPCARAGRAVAARAAPHGVDEAGGEERHIEEVCWGRRGGAGEGVREQRRASRGAALLPHGSAQRARGGSGSARLLPLGPACGARSAAASPAGPAPACRPTLGAKGEGCRSAGQRQARQLRRSSRVRHPAPPATASRTRQLRAVAAVEVARGARLAQVAPLGRRGRGGEQAA